MLTYDSLERAASLAWAAHRAPLLASALALAVALLATALRRPALAAAAGPVGVAVGWAALAAVGGAPRLALSPRTLPERLLLPAALALVAVAVLPLARGRWATAGWMLLGALIGWWLAGTPAARVEFWRVGAACTLLAWALAASAGRDAGPAAAAALTLWGALLLVGAPAMSLGAASVVAAAALGSLVARPWPPAPALAVLAAAAAAAASLGGGRLVRGQVAAVDVACLAAAVAPWLVRPIGGLVPRAAWLAPFAAAAAATGAAWAIARVAPIR